MDQRVVLDREEKWDRLDLLVNEEDQEQEEKLDHPVVLVDVAKLDLQVHQDLLAQPDPRDQLVDGVNLDLLDLRDPQDQGERLEHQALQDNPVKLDQQDRQDRGDNVVKPDNLVLKVGLEKPNEDTANISISKSEK